MPASPLNVFLYSLFAHFFAGTSTASTPAAAPTAAPAAAASSTGMAANPNASTPATTKPATGSYKLYDGIVASVGDEIILFSDVQKALRVATNGASSIDSTGKIKGASSDKDVSKMLDQLIDQRILTLKVKELQLTVSEDELESEIDTFLKGQSLTREKFLEMLKEENETFENYREEFRRQLETQRFVGRVIRPLVTVTDDELRNVYLQKSGAKERDQKLKLRSLVINSATDAAQKTKVETVKKQVSNGTDFVEVVKNFSESPDAAKTAGVLPPRSPGELPADVWQKLKSAKINDVVGPFQLGNSVFFFQYLGRDINNLADFEKQKPTLETQLMETKFQERLGDYLKAERNKVRIARSDIKFFK